MLRSSLLRGVLLSFGESSKLFCGLEKKPPQKSKHLLVYSEWYKTRTKRNYYSLNQGWTFLLCCTQALFHIRVGNIKYFCSKSYSYILNQNWNRKNYHQNWNRKNYHLVQKQEAHGPHRSPEKQFQSINTFAQKSLSPFWDLNSWSFIKTWVPFTQKYIEIDLVVLEMKKKMWKFTTTKTPTTMRMTDNRQIVIKKITQAFGSGELKTPIHWIPSNDI